MIKLLRFLVLIFAVFLPDFNFLYHSGTFIQVSSKLWMFLISTSHKTRTFTVRLAVFFNDQYQGNGFAADVLLGRDPSRVVQIGPIVRGVIVFYIGNMMECDHQSCDPVDPLGAYYGISNIFQQRPSAILNLKILIFDHVTVITVLTCFCVPSFIEIASRVRPPASHNCI